MTDQYQKAMLEILKVVDDEVSSPVDDILLLMKFRHPEVSEDDLKLLILEAKSQR